MYKLNQRKMRWIVRQKDKGELTNQDIAAIQGITPRYVRMLYKKAKKYGIESLYHKPPGRPKQTIPEKQINLIKQVYKQHKQGAVMLQRIIKEQHEVHIPKDRIHRVMIQAGYTKPNLRKQKQRKWVRYEWPRSNDLWHTDWFQFNQRADWFIAYLDDHSRFMVSHGLFNEATSSKALFVLKQGIDSYGKPIRVLTDRGTQFYCSEKEAKELGLCKFQIRLQKWGICHIVGRVNHPQTNGKIERVFQELQKHWDERFKSIDDLIKWYNYEKLHMSLNFQTPAEVYFKDLEKREEEISR